MPVRFLHLIAFAGLAIALSATSTYSFVSRQPKRPSQLDAKTDRIIFHDRQPISNARKDQPPIIRHTILLVDRDDNIRLVAYDRPSPQENDGGRPGGVILGQLVTRSGNLGLSQYIGRGEVPFKALRTTLRSGVTIHLFLAWGQTPESLIAKEFDFRFSAVVSYFYAVQEDRGKATLVFREEQGGMFSRPFSNLSVEDINNDGDPEIVLLGMSSPRSHWMKIWRIRGDGGIERMAFEGEDASPSLDCLVPNAPCGIMTETHHQRDGYIIKTHKLYGWNPLKHEYELRSTFTERTVVLEDKPPLR